MPGGIIPIGPDIGGCMICPLPTGGNICGGGGPRIGAEHLGADGIIGGPEPIPLGGGIQNCGATGVPTSHSLHLRRAAVGRAAARGLLAALLGAARRGGAIPGAAPESRWEDSRPAAAAPAPRGTAPACFCCSGAAGESFRHTAPRSSELTSRPPRFETYAAR